MTDSAARGAGKRERLVAAARELLHRQGVSRTSLAEVAHAADVPAGNVYYYFKTKDDLVEAVVESYGDNVEELLAGLERQRAPRARLKALVRHWVEMREEVAARGCPMGSLACELGKSDRPSGERALRLVVAWAERQFRELGERRPGDLAVALLSGIQGAALLANALGDPEILVGEARHLERWIDDLAGKRAS